MPDRATSRGLLYAGVTLVVLAGPLIVGPVLWDRTNRAQNIAARDTELGEIVASVNAMREILGTLREVHGGQLAYLLTGTQQDKNMYRSEAELARKAFADLREIYPPMASAARLDAIGNRVLGDLERGVALQDAGRHEEAVDDSRIATSRELMTEMDGIVRTSVLTLRDRYQKVVAGARDDAEWNDTHERIMFSLAGASFALGFLALVIYQRRHLTAEQDLRTGRDAALEAAAIKTRVVATASHDLRQPLHAISMFVGVLRRRVQDPALLEVIANIGIAVASMQRMFAALLDVARLDADAVAIERARVGLQDMFDTLMVEFAVSATAKGLALQIAPTDIVVTSDPALLETILRNLLSNAVKFTDHGAVGIMVGRRGPLVELTVFDTGIGIADEDREAIFGQFERRSHAGNNREGLGLGLAIVQRMADMLGIALVLDSQPGQGARFTLALPAAGPVPRPAPIAASEPSPQLHGQRILVLDDHPEARKAIALAIETLGAIPLEAGSPGAVERLLADMAPDVPNAAVVDHDLGGGQTGPGFLDAYAIRHGHALPGLIITGSTDARTLAALTASGRPWMIKPIDLENLRATLAKLIGPSPGWGLAHQGREGQAASPPGLPPAAEPLESST